MNFTEVTDGNIEYAHGEGFISTLEVGKAIQGLTCLADGKLSPGEQLCLSVRSKHGLQNITANDLTKIPNPPARTLNENCLKCEEFAPARTILAKHVVKIVNSI
ncbi:MAG: hypothetical protein ACD_12C00367G0001 [uncultured bacterium]|nr:MAG: hypothetical protein ACD_12C00367G0001 [uncultured bacterium]